MFPLYSNHHPQHFISQQHSASDRFRTSLLEVMSLPCSHYSKWPVLIRWWKIMSIIAQYIGIVNPTIGFNQHSLCIRKATQSLPWLIQHLNRVHTEQFRVYTESTQSDSVSTQSLYRAIKGLYRIYTEWYVVYTESIQSKPGSIQSLHRVICETLHRVYTDWFSIHTESTQTDSGSIQSLHRVI